MTVTAYKTNRLQEQNATVYIVTGFTGQLKYWWDNSLTLVDKQTILNHEIEVEDAQGTITRRNDSTSFLIVTIATHFVGNPAEELGSSKIFLTNLRCPTLSDFRWYKDMFLTHVLKRSDSTKSFWKEKFITGLPNLFSQRVFTSIKKAMGIEDDNIDFSTITYGQLFAFVKKEALLACQELKFQAKYGNKRKEMGPFCEAFGITGIKAPSIEKKHKQKMIPYKKHKPKKYKYSRKHSNKDCYQSKRITCYKCCKPGHIVNKCKLKGKNRINEIIDNLSDIDSNIKENFKEKLQLYSEINKISEDDGFYYSSSSSDHTCTCKQIKMINTRNTLKLPKAKNLKKDSKELIFDMIQQIPDPEKQKEH